MQRTQLVGRQLNNRDFEGGDKLYLHTSRFRYKGYVFILCEELSMHLLLSKDNYKLKIFRHIFPNFKIYIKRQSLNLNQHCLHPEEQRCRNPLQVTFYSKLDKDRFAPELISADECVKYRAAEFDEWTT